MILKTGPCQHREQRDNREMLTGAFDRATAAIETITLCALGNRKTSNHYKTMLSTFG